MLPFASVRYRHIGDARGIAVRAVADARFRTSIRRRDAYVRGRWSKKFEPIVDDVDALMADPALEDAFDDIGEHGEAACGVSLED